LIKLAKISSIDGQSVELDFQKNSECSDCKSHCPSGFLDFLFHQNNHKLVVSSKNSCLKNTHLIDHDSFFNKPHKVNDVVGIKFNEDQLLRFSLLLYGLPIVLLTLCLILGYVLFSQLGFNSDLGGLLGLLFGLYISKGVISHLKLKSIPKVKFFK